MNNQLVNGYWILPAVKAAGYTQKEDLVDGVLSRGIFLKCQLCDHMTHKSGILIADKDFSQGLLQGQPRSLVLNS